MYIMRKQIITYKLKQQSNCLLCIEHVDWATSQVLQVEVKDIMAVFVEDRVDFWCDDAAQNHCLTVIFSPVKTNRRAHSLTNSIFFINYSI